MHDAKVIAYSANPWDTNLTLAIECHDCQSQWGWAADKNGAASRMEAEAVSHRRNFRAKTTTDGAGNE
jgi:hypothetical protein